MHSLSNAKVREQLLEDAKRSLREAGLVASEESLFAEVERLSRRGSSDPVAGASSSPLETARQLLAIQGTEESYESLCGAVDFLYPNLRGVTS